MPANQIFEGIVMFVVLLFSLSFHEFGHAWTASRRGDPTPRHLGRVTLNPMAHADLIGTILFPLLQIFSGVPLIGWAKPVPFVPANLRNPHADIVLVASAGPVFNVILAVAAAVLWRANALLLGGMDGGMLATLHDFLLVLLPPLLQINVLLALFNLIPMPPLDGSYLVESLLPRPLAAQYRAFGAQWGFVVVLVLVYTGVARRLIGFGSALVSPVLAAIAGI
jgi:Zn-dependent protease